MSTGSPKSWMWLMCAILCGPAFGQNGFTWQNSSIGGGGYCMEIRFAPYNIFWSGNNPALFLATDVSGLYRSYDYGNTWQRFESLYLAASEQDIAGRYVTSIGFTTQNAGLVAGTLDGIYYGPGNGQNWSAAWMPQRDNLPADLQGKMAEYDDGRYPRISLIRENLHDPQFMLAGIGDLRERAQHVQTGQKDRTNFGLGALFRSTNGGAAWDLVRLEQESTKGIGYDLVYDIDFMTDSDGDVHTFVCTGFTERTSAANANQDTYAYEGGIYYSSNAYKTLSSGGITPPEEIVWKRITDKSNGQAGLFLTNMVSLAMLCDESNANPALDSPILAFASRCGENDNVDNPKGGVYKAEFTLNDLKNGNFPNWSAIHQEVRTGQLGAKPGSNRSVFELYLGKSAGERIVLGVTDQDHGDGPASFAKIVNECPDQITSNNCSDPSLQVNGVQNDIGYREWKGKPNTNPTQWLTDLKFASFDFDPNNTLDHPTVYAGWAYGPLQAEGHNQPEPYNKRRSFQQIFTQVSGVQDGNDKAYTSRGMDEFFFTGCPVAFHPKNAAIIMIGVGDNGLVRSTDGGASWTQRWLRPSKSWWTDYGQGAQHFVYHLAFHPLNPNLVLASAGTEDNLRPDDGKKGELLRNTNGGAGNENSWTVIAGGVNALSVIPNAQIQSFAFDVKDDNASDDKMGLFVAVRNKGIYYGMIKTNGTVDATFKFKRIADQQLKALIPVQADPNNATDDGGHHNYSRIVFDPYDANTLYVARQWPSGGVFRIKLGTATGKPHLRARYLNGSSYNEGFITEAVEVIKGRYSLKNIEAGPPNANRASDVINLLITQNEVFAGTTCGHRADDGSGNNYAGGLVRWTKVASPPPPNQLINNWVIGGPLGIGPASNTIAIGGLALEPSNGVYANQILAVTLRYSLRADRLTSSNKYQGEENHKFTNIWASSNGGQTFSKVPHTDNQLLWADAVTMAYVPGNPNKIIMPTHGNGVWIGTRPANIISKVTEQNASAADRQLPKHFALHQNYPNPFNPSTLIKYDLPRETRLTLTIFDVLGRRVRVLAEGETEAGYHEVLWDGKNNAGFAVPSGVYFYTFHAPGFHQVRKMTLLR